MSEALARLSGALADRYRLEAALAFAHAFRDRENAVPLAPGARHWNIFTRLCREAAARGNLAPDAWLAALAIESGCELVTTDRDFARFRGLRWRHPFGSGGLAAAAGAASGLFRAPAPGGMFGSP